MKTRREDVGIELMQFEPEPVAQQLPVPTVATPAVLLAMAVQQGADLDRLERLMALQERWEKNEAKKEADGAMSAFRGEPIDITKKKHVSYKLDSGGRVDYHHAELADITSAIGPALAKHGLTYRWDVQQTPNSITVECIVAHRGGHSHSVSMHAPPDNSGKKNPIQQIASTVTYLERYTLQAALGLSSRDDDDDGRGGDDVEEVRPPVKPAAKTPWPDEAFAKWVSTKAQDAINKGAQHDSVLGFAAAKGSLTEDQKAAILALTKQAPAAEGAHE
jgi:hypothetical protein